MTVVWHVNDIKISHKDLFEVTKFDQYLSMIYRDNPKVHKKTWLPRYGFGLIRTRGVKILDNKIFKEGPRRVPRRVERDVRHSNSRPYVPNNKLRGSRVFR